MSELRRNLEDLVNDPKGYLSMLADRLHNTALGRKAVINREGAGYRNLTREERAEQMTKAALDNLGGGGLGIIKSKGGNWLTGSVENALSGLKKSTDLPTARNLWGNGAEKLSAWTPEELVRFASDNDRLGVEAKAVLRNLPLNNWIEGPLTKYVKRDMATEGDPVRKLAEQGVLHFDPRGEITPGTETKAALLRSKTGNLAGGLSDSGLGRAWETLSDSTLEAAPARDWMSKAKPEVLETMPWLSKLPENEMVYERSDPNLAGMLNFHHLTDELSNALNPESGLPRHLQLTPEQMQQMGMEKAVRHVADINAWRAAQKAEANKAMNQHPAVHMVREYAENNPKGLRWVEIKPSGKIELPEGYTVEPNSTYLGKTGYQLRTPNGDRLGLPQATEEAALAELKDPRYKVDKHLQEQLKYEGDTMGHCVGGYCEDVASGNSRIFSLRDAKGEPHVTIETVPWMGNPDLWNSEYPSLITQIKGKQNRKPKDEYLPFVQDFVRNHPEGGQWGDVGDFHNTGLRRTSDAWNTMEQARIKSKGIEIPDYMTQADIDAIEKQVWAPNGYASGGSVKPNTTWRPMELDGIIAYITD